MPMYTEVDSALQALEDVQKRMAGGGGTGRGDGAAATLTQVNNDLNTLLSVLSNPMFQKLCKIQDSVKELGTQMVRHPSITTNDFEISNEGKLVLKISPPSDKFRPTFDKTPYEAKKAVPAKPVPTARAVSTTPQTLSRTSSKFEDAEELFPTGGAAPVFLQDEFEIIIEKAALGRDVHKICLCKPEGSSLGFSVVGLKSQEKGELGIFVQEIQPTGIAAKDGRLAEGDQILAIDGQPLDAAITHQQAIGILQQARGEVEIIVARAPDLLYPLDPLVPGDTIGAGQLPPLLGGERPSSPPAEDSKGTDMVLNTEWAQVEVIELINDGTGLGFGIIGGRSTGVVVKTILPGGVADRDGRLQSGDHILQIGDVNLLGMGSEQVAAVLRQCGSCVRLVVARPIEPTSPDAFSSQAPIVPTRILGDPEELERHLLQANGYGNGLMHEGSIGSGDTQLRLGEEGVGPSGTFDSLPEVEIVDVELKKDSHGLGITIAGYVCEKEELSGIFVKSISEGSAADLSGRICINDRIVEVDGQSLQGFTNHQAVEVLRKTGPIVHLKLERYHHGTKYDQLQSAISHSEHKPPTPSSVSALSLPQVPVDSDGEGEEELLATTGILGEEEEEEEEEEDEEMLRKDTRNVDMDLEDLEMLIDTRYDGEILVTVEAAILAKWGKIMGPDCEIVVSQLSKSKEGGGLGISLEGTVDVEDGREVRPHHYIRSILADGPVGLAGQLMSGDELLEVNGRRLLGLNHVEVVSILKDLPMHVRIVCARRPGAPPPSRPIDTSQDRNAFAARNILGGSLQNLFQGSDRLVKAKSDGSLASTGTTAVTETSLSKLKSRSLEPLTGLAMWSSEPTIIELPKGDRGLGFSILDYQDPMNPNETVIVIRSLVPGGVAQQDGRLIPGDRLLAVNDTNLENATLDQAVQALKGALRGIVRIAVAKPLPLPDSSAATISSVQSEKEVTPPPPLPVSPPPAELSPRELSSNLSPLSPRTPTFMLDSVDSTVDVSPSVPIVPPPPRDLILKTNEIDFTNQVTPLIPVATERLITSASSNGRSASTITILSGSSLTSTTSTTVLHQEAGGDSSSRSTPAVTGTSTTTTSTTTTSTTSAEMSVSSSPLPQALEQTIKIMKLEEPLGVNVELVDEGVNGVMVTSTAVGGPFHRDGRIQAGDYIVAINNESLRHVTNAQARAILRRAQLFSKELSVSFIPGGDAEVYRESLLIQQNLALDPRETIDEAVGEEETAEDLIVQRRGGSSDRNRPIDVGLTPARTPADGQESSEDAVGLQAAPPQPPSAVVGASSSSAGTSPGSTIVSRVPKPQPGLATSTVTSTAGAPHKTTLSATLSPAAVGVGPSGASTTTSSTTSTSYTALDIIPSPATQPTVQKRVVTHVTIFPSPPPDLVQLTRTTTSSISKPVLSSGGSVELLDKFEKSEGSESFSTGTATGTDQEPTNKTEEVSSGGSSVPAVQQLRSSSSTERIGQVFTVVKEPLKSTQSSSVSSGGVGGLKKSLSRGQTLTPSSSVENNSYSVGGEMGVKEQLSSASEEHTLSNSKGAGTSGGSGDESALLLAKHWGPERLVEVHREVGKSLGISIVGGKVDLYNAGPDSGSAISGIFIKNVLPNSPAGKTGQLKTGDRILAVDDVDLRSASHEKAVDVIRASGNPVRFLVQSLVQWGDGRGVSIANHDDSEGPSERSEGTETKSQSYSQTVQSHSYSGTETTSSTCTSRTRTTTNTETTSRTETNGETTQRSLQSGSSGSPETTSQIEKKNGHDKRGGGDADAEDYDDDDEPELQNVHLRADSPTLLKVAPPSVTPARTPSPELIQAGLADEEKQQLQAKMEAASKVGVKGKAAESDESEHSSEEDDELGDDRQLQGKTRSKQGIEIDRASAGNFKRSKADETSDSETEDEFGYTQKKIEKRWSDVAKNNDNARIVVAVLERTAQEGLGISLAGHRDRMKMATYICGINPAGLAHKTRQLEVGDEILEVNGTVLYGRCHLNASAMIKTLPQNKMKIVALRKSEGLNELSVKPIVQFPVSLESESPEEKYASYKGLRVVTLKKIGGGLGIMIMEGRHAELGQGIFISDIQEGSPAEQAGLFVGDMILAVNGEDMVGSDYEHAANTLKKTEGNVALVVCNASKGKDTEDSKDGPKEKTKEEPKKEPEKPRLPPKPSKIPSPSKLISSVSSAISSRTKFASSSSSTNNTVTSPSSAVLVPPGVSGSTTKLSTTPPTSTTIIVPTSVGISHSTSSTGLIGLFSKSTGTTPTAVLSAPSVPPTSSTSFNSLSTSAVPSVVVKPATPSPKLHPAVSPTGPGCAKMALLVKNRLEEPPADPVTCAINPGKETTIEINKDKMGLGLSIVGGSDTLLGSIIIHEVYPDGAAAKDGRLKPGDQLLSVNNEDFGVITHSKALAALRQTPTKVRMVVFRDEGVAKEDDMYDSLEVELVKKSGKGLGLSIVGRKNGSGVFISDVVPGGIAELHGGLMKGDMIISVNGVDLKNSTQEEAASVLKTAIGPIHMKIGRLKAAANRRSTSSTPATVPATPTSDNKNDLGLEEGLSEEEVSASRNSNSSVSNPPSLTGSPPQVKNIILERGQDGLGFSIVGGYGSPHGNLPIYVKTVFDKGAAVISGLKRGDQIIAVNSTSCEGLTHQDAVALLKNAKGNVSVTILT